ncbi:MAG: peptide-methionine (S)-S-oxide reductase MsrA [Pseudomonadota bacterium]
MLKTRMITPAEALPGRAQPAFMLAKTHAVFSDRTLLPPYPKKLSLAMFGMGCFWGAEKCFWSIDGVYVTAVGYAGGYTPHPTYEEVCSGYTGHNEVVRVVYDPQQIRYQALLKIFWEAHNPTQGMRQGNDVGTQYRSGIYAYTVKQRQAALASMRAFQKALSKQALGTITAEIVDAPEFYFAEPYHQQYLAKNPDGYCGLGGLSIELPARRQKR